MPGSLPLWFGAFLWLFGVSMVVAHVLQRRASLRSAIEEPADLQFVERRYRRRMQTSALTMTLGALIVLCDYLPPFKSSPGLAAGYILAMLLLSIWLVLLAVGDAMASRVHLAQAMRNNMKTRQSLQATLDEMRRKQAAQFDRDIDELTISSGTK